AAQPPARPVSPLRARRPGGGGARPTGRPASPRTALPRGECSGGARGGGRTAPLAGPFPGPVALCPAAGAPAEPETAIHSGPPCGPPREILHHRRANRFRRRVGYRAEAVRRA